MANKKTKELKNLSKTEQEKKLKELQMELIKSKIDSSKKGSARTKEIKKMIALIHTLKKINMENKISAKDKK